LKSPKLSSFSSSSAIAEKFVVSFSRGYGYFVLCCIIRCKFFTVNYRGRVGTI
jgi:hypothetical protein